MAHHFNPDMQNMGIDPNMDILMNPFQDFNPAGPGLMGFSQDNYPGHDHHHHFPGNLAADNFPLVFPEEFKSLLSITTEPNCSSANDRRHLEVLQDHSCDDEKKRKSMHTPECSSANSSPPVSENGIARRNSTARGKRLRSNEKEDEKSSKEVVHVRAKRGQATDSHSLAERVRRGKINERLRCLQDIVPGCQRTMGMAVMLDEIINYVQSLQNQVEFLSMKLTAASNLYSYSGEADTIDAIQRAKALEAMKMHRRMKEEWEEIAASTQVGPFDLTFGCYPSSPFNT